MATIDNNNEEFKYYIVGLYFIFVLACFEFYYRCKYLPAMRAWANNNYLDE